MKTRERYKPKPRKLAQDGLSMVDANKGRLVTYGPDVLDIKRQIESKWAGILSCVFDLDTEEWVIIEHTKDGTDKLAFTTPTLSQATLDKIDRIDQTSRSYVDPNKVFEAEDRVEDRAKDHRFSEAVGEVAERLYFALRKDGVIDRPQVFFAENHAA